MTLTQRRQAVRWLLITLLLLLVAASRFTRLHELRMNPDEVWSVWQTFGTAQQILDWTPYDWPPLYYLATGLWWRLTAPHPEILRLLSVLVFMLGTACLYRLVRHLRDHQVALLSALAYAALGYGILLSIEVRGYALLMGLMPLALWWTVRYFERRTVLSGVLLALALAAMFYTSYTSALAILILGLYTLLVYGRAIWRWWLPGAVTAVLIVPELLKIRGTAVQRIAATQTLDPGPLPDALYNLFWNWAGELFWLWLLLLAIGVLLALYRERRLSRQLVALLIWTLLLPVALYILNPLLGFFSARYAWWVMPGLALLMGWGLRYLPLAGRVGAALALTVMIFYPLPVDRYSIWGSSISPLGDNFIWLRERIQWGDVLLLDDSSQCGAAEEWDYYTRVHFPQGLQFVDTPAHYRRVWFVTQAGREDETLRAALDRHHIRRDQVGPARCIFLLYESPPDTAGIAFENGMRFHGMDILREDGRARHEPPAYHRGEMVRLRLWWSADTALSLDYSVGAFLIGRAVMDEIHGPPFVIYPPDAPQETSRWQPGIHYYIEERSLAVSASARSADYDLYLNVYYWEDALPLAAPGTDDNGLLHLGRITVKRY
jgi:hypothetical protein